MGEETPSGGMENPVLVEMLWEPYFKRGLPSCPKPQKPREDAGDSHKHQGHRPVSQPWWGSSTVPTPPPYPLGIQPCLGLQGLSVGDIMPAPELEDGTQGWST